VLPQHLLRQHPYTLGCGQQVVSPAVDQKLQEQQQLQQALAEVGAWLPLLPLLLHPVLHQRQWQGPPVHACSAGWRS
jgi:hypothetical protein